MEMISLLVGMLYDFRICAILCQGGKFDFLVQYDLLGNVITATALANTSTPVVRFYRYQTDFNKLRIEVDPMGYTTAFNYDQKGNMIRATDAQDHVIDVSYLSSGQVSSVTSYPNGQSATYSFTYAGGDLVGVTDPLGRQTGLATDNIGRPIRIRDGLGNASSVTYDPRSGD